MPTVSLDTLLASSVMICLVLSSMVGVFTAVQPFIENQTSSYDAETSRRLAEYLLLETGSPADWGAETNETLISFGLAKENASTPFELDIDKVTRLNERNKYNLSFLEAFTALNTKDKPFKIIIKPVFNATVTLSSQTEEASEITYHFNISTKRSNLPVAASFKCYAVIGNYVTSNSSSTSSLGEGSIDVSLPKSLNGTALLVIFAQIEPKILSYTVHSFAHNSGSSPNQAGSYATLSPLNYTLRADLTSSSNRILYAKVFTYDYTFSLTQTENASTTQCFAVPKILDESPMILVGTGLNASSSEYFAEWVSYPQIPLDFGLDFTGRYHLADALSSRFLVTINSATYECKIIIGGT